MTIQMLEKSATTRNFFAINPPTIILSSTAMQASSIDFGFDFNEQELARELLAGLPDLLSNQTSMEIEPEEFETGRLWFYS
jgi:hypothetical protein